MCFRFSWVDPLHFFVAVCIFLGLIIVPFIPLLTSHVPVTNSALNLVTETLNVVVSSFYPPR